MGRLQRVIAVLGVVYLLTVGVLYMVLAERYDVFLKQGQTLTGTVTAIRAAPTGDSSPLRNLTHPGGSTIAVIQYRYEGEKGSTTSSPYSSPRKYVVGQHVTLVAHRASSGNPDDDVVAVKDRTAAGMRAAPYGFFVSAAAVAWFLGILPHRPDRRRRLRSRTAGRKISRPSTATPGTP
ncbi:hypothetical protein [Acidipropionibacterium virtanenii]|uniref:DUF3592 domain-containing protein n=1 Tax=Acidipropionibacterium virtanenii TaxID=2057246 RepID=A0A344UPU8_9ACTN|nr:hypothetical protein [Acidipropionibacterium virtanenii]AXE37296.1 hypothetical protein JS278_00099 [Acidipropionibacterium virtanenii]